MTGFAGGGNRSTRSVCGARLPRRRAPRGAAAVASGRGLENGREWLLLPQSGWRRVYTIRVRHLFG